MPPSAPKTAKKSSLNPNWPQYACFGTIVVALVAAFMRYFVIDAGDPYKCNSLLNSGRWTDSSFVAWQPDGCMTNNYNPASLATCFNPNSGRRVVFIGDSITRQLFYAMARSADPAAPEGPSGEEGQKHQDVKFTASSKAGGLQFEFYWDPFLNSTHTIDLLSTPFLSPSPATLPSTVSRASSTPKQPALLILGSGLWYLRHPSSGGLSSWEARIDSTFDLISTSTSTSRPSIAHPFSSSSLSRRPGKAGETGGSMDRLIADEVVFLPVLEPVRDLLSKERKETLLAADIDAMNSDLSARLSPSSYFYTSPPLAAAPPLTTASLTSPASPPPISLPLSFNSLLEPSQTTDGLHFSSRTLAVKAQLLWNLRCNDVMPKTFPMDKTCCKRYPMVGGVQAFVMALVVGWVPFGWAMKKQIAIHPSLTPLFPSSPSSPVFQTLATFSASIFLTFLSDRTPLYLKENKAYDPWTFGILCLAALAAGLATCKRSEGGKDLGFLNREQTDEWKGWMQIAILIYHYLGASKISGIYNPIRVLVAAYLFMTGYGHFTYYYKKNDFGLDRVAMVMVRLNLLPIVLAYTMQTDYISYYFSPLVSFWYLIIYATMFLGNQYNKNHYFLSAKLFVSMGLVAWFMKTGWILQSIFDFLRAVAFINWSAKEWSFRVTLDLYAPFLGIFTAYLYIVLQSLSPNSSPLSIVSPSHPQFPNLVKLASLLSILSLLWFFHFELSQPSKFAYNAYHPVVASVPILAFIVLRNATPFLRSVRSGAFCWVGRISLETFILQFHLWLAADTKGILVIVPGGGGDGWLGGLGGGWRWMNGLVAGVVFLYVSQKMAQVSGVMTEYLVGKTKKPRELPVPVVAVTGPSPSTSPGPRSALASDNNKNGGSREEAIPLLPVSSSPEPSSSSTLLQPSFSNPFSPSSTSSSPSFSLASGMPKSFSFDSLKGNTGLKLAGMMLLCWVLNLLSAI